MFDESFFVAVSFFTVIGAFIYLKLPSKLMQALDEKSAEIARELDDAKALRAEAEKVLRVVDRRFSLGLALEHGLIGGAALDEHGVPLPEDTLARAREVDAILLGAVGGPKWDGVERGLRPERGLLSIRSELQLFGNLDEEFC